MPMIWTCRCGHSNPREATVCRACLTARPAGPPTVGPAEEARYRSLASARAWAVMADALAVYGRRILSFITAGLLMALPLFLFQTWQWRTDQI
ncbi:MAG: hypothetical protein ACE5KY_01065, partial [Candidatus Tectimicrobiota bacterium]